MNITTSVSALELYVCVYIYIYIYIFISRVLIQHAIIRNYNPTRKKPDMTMRGCKEACNPLCSLPCGINKLCVGSQTGNSRSARDSTGGSVLDRPKHMAVFPLHAVGGYSSKHESDCYCQYYNRAKYVFLHNKQASYHRRLNVMLCE